MELIKHNQLLKIRVGYFQEIGRLCFRSFIQHSGIEKIGESMRGMKCLRPELLDLALERVQAMQHTDIVC